MVEQKKIFVPRPPESPEVIEARWKKKKARIEELSSGIRKLRLNVSKDLKSDNEKDSLTALVVATMLLTAERIGNDSSAGDGHLGVTGFQRSNVSISGNTVSLDYTGKSGVRHEKCFTDERIAKALKTALKNSPSKYVFETSDGFRIKADRVNRYLSPHNISAKDLRGFLANQYTVEKLKKIEPEETDKKRKKQLNAILKIVAQKVGHGRPTLKKHYLVPELWDEWVERGKIIDLKDMGYLEKGGSVEMEAGGKIPTAKTISKDDKTYINYLLEYVYYNNPVEEDDEMLPTDAPDWIIKSSYEYLKNKGIDKIYRGSHVSGAQFDEAAWSWTYDKDVAKGFAGEDGKVFEKPLPENVVSVEFVFKWVRKNKYAPEYASHDFINFIEKSGHSEREVIVIPEQKEKGGELIEYMIAENDGKEFRSRFDREEAIADAKSIFRKGNLNKIVVKDKKGNTYFEQRKKSFLEFYAEDGYLIF